MSANTPEAEPLSAADARLVIAGGGTGGHLMPALAVARELAALGARRIVFIGTARGLEAKLVPEAGFDLRLIAVGGLKGKGLGRRMRALAQLPWAVAQCMGYLRRERAQAVLGVGGYASGPALAAARLLRIPIILLEVNAKTGLANRVAARWAAAAAVNFAETEPDFARAGTVQATGIPVRAEFFRRAAPATPGRVLIFGGSQGARALNAASEDLAPLLPAGCSVQRQTGAADFIADMAGAMAAAQVVVCRAGASTLGELAAAGRASILVPLPSAADNHQLRNAEAFARAGAALVLEQSRLSPTSLARELRSLLESPARVEAMQRAAQRLARPGAGRAIARLVLSARR